MDFAPQKTKPRKSPQKAKTIVVRSGQAPLKVKKPQVTSSQQVKLKSTKTQIKATVASDPIAAKAKTAQKNAKVLNPKVAPHTATTSKNLNKFGINDTKNNAEPNKKHHLSEAIDEAAKKSQKNPKSRFILRAVRLLSAFVLSASAILALVTVITSRLIPDKFVLIGTIAILLWTVPFAATIFRKKEKARTSIIFSLLAVVFSIVNIFAFIFLSSTEGFLSYIDQEPEEAVTATTPVEEVRTTPFVVYISGRDAGGSLSDVNQLAVINPNTHKILLINTPRDYYVQLAGKTGLKDKLTHAGTYGLNTSIQTLENLYDTEINYYLQIRFESLVKLVNTIGGITVRSAYAFDEFVVGENQLNGDQALRFARNRKSFAGGDRVRGENQQRVISALIDKLASPSTLTNYLNILDSMQGTFVTNFGSDNISKFAKRQLDNPVSWTVETYSVDGTGSYSRTYSYPNQDLYVMIPDESTVKTAKARLQETLR